MSSTMKASELRSILNKFIANAKKEMDDELSYKQLYAHVKIYSKNVNINYTEEPPRKKSSRKNTTEPGDVFDGSLCHCRVWNKGYAKQCSNKPKIDETL